MKIHLFILIYYFQIRLYIVSQYSYLSYEQVIFIKMILGARNPRPSHSHPSLWRPTASAKSFSRREHDSHNGANTGVSFELNVYFRTFLKKFLKDFLQNIEHLRNNTNSQRNDFGPKRGGRSGYGGEFRRQSSWFFIEILQQKMKKLIQLLINRSFFQMDLP